MVKAMGCCGVVVIISALGQWRSDGGPTGRSPRAALVKGRHTESNCQKLCCVRKIK